MDSRLGGQLRQKARRTPGFTASPTSPGLAALARKPSPRLPRRDIWHAPDHAFEIDCLRGLLPPGLLAAAAARADALGIGAEQVLINWHAVSADTYIARLARHCGVAIEDFAAVNRRDCPLTNRQLTYALGHLLLPLHSPRGRNHVLAPTGIGARRLVQFCARFPQLRQHITLTTPAALIHFLMRQPLFANDAAHGLANRMPAFSAAPAFKRGTFGWRAPLNLIIAMSVVVVMPMTSLQLVGAILTLWFVLFNALRLAGAVMPRQRPLRQQRLADNQLPVYTIMAALYREGRSVAGLLRALAKLNYPPEKLDIKIIIEPDDPETYAALATQQIPANVQVVFAPASGPRTKPKALNYALPLARGALLTVFDAEDRPEPDQLRRAINAFRHASDNVACVQASLCIDNTADSLLTRMFTAEYAGQFDASLQGFSRFGLPLPLGGSSNHFKTEVLRKAGGWDPYNVTEDADLGMRLARLGYRAQMFGSTTYEEAPARLGAWLRQRTRWLKGWMQTWMVHMRSPSRLWRDSGPAGCATLTLLIGGHILTALAYPALLWMIALAIFSGTNDALSLFTGPLAWFYIAAFGLGCVSSIAVNAIGLSRRRLLRESWILVLTPLYWLILSIAAWRALLQLLRDPYHWEKTEHGLARHSRIGRHAFRG